MTDPFTAAMWARCADVRRDIGRHPFVSGLLDGTLPRPAFDRYVVQDVHYLTGYAAALRVCAAQAGGTASIFWAGVARDTVEIERSLHRAYLHGRPLPTRSVHCAAYLSFLLDLSRTASPPMLAAAVLPCFWIFSDLGERCAGMDLAGHPYADWVESYRDPRFAAATGQARELVEDLAAGSAAAVRAGMQEVFGTACRYEWLLFDDAWTGAAGSGAAESGDGAPAALTGAPPAPRARPNGSASASATTKEVSEADSHG